MFNGNLKLIYEKKALNYHYFYVSATLPRVALYMTLIPTVLFFKCSVMEMLYSCKRIHWIKLKYLVMICSRLSSDHELIILLCMNQWLS